MNRKYIQVLFCRILNITLTSTIIIYAGGCRQQEDNRELFSRTGDVYIDSIIERVENESFTSVYVYRGLLPCADCSGIETRIILINDELLYILTERFIGIRDGDDHVYSSYGPYTTVRGFKDNPNSLVYILNPESPEARRYYLSIEPTEIRMLDRDMQLFDSELNYTMTLTYSATPGK
jgi:hypothetical protein